VKFDGDTGELCMVESAQYSDYVLDGGGDWCIAEEVVIDGSPPIKIHQEATIEAAQPSRATDGSG